MHKLALASVTAALLLAGCGKPETITGSKPSDPDAATVAAAAPVKLPPALLASKTFRCKDNSLVYIDFFNDNTTANFKASKTSTPVALTAPAAGQPYVGSDYTLTGKATDASIKLTRPGKGEQECDA